MRFERPAATLEVSATEVLGAIDFARQGYPHKWQAALLEILLLPHVHNHWQQMNNRFPAVQIHRHTGVYYPNEIDMQEFRDLLLFEQVHGYYFSYGLPNYGWNAVRRNYYAHSPSSTWDGVRRETFHSWVEDLYSAVQQHEVNDRIQSHFDSYNVRLLEEPAQGRFA